MKNDLDYYHKFSIVEYSLNIKKFREYVKYLFKLRLNIVEKTIYSMKK
jgi:hypothetical protein